MNHPNDPRITRKMGKLAAAVILLVAAAAILGYHLLSDNTQAIADPTAKVKMVCKSCNYEFEMPFSDYLKQAPKGTQTVGGLTCPKCGTKSVHRIEMHIPGAEPANAPPPAQEPVRKPPPMSRID